MADNVVIRAEGLGKSYRIRQRGSVQHYETLREALVRGARGAGRGMLDMMRGRPRQGADTIEAFWALRDLSFEIRQGDVVGVIGRNGAGKSTLLKVLSRITEPTEGRVTLKGRVASLLEVGTGFHPELTGRENIYLNGAVLGMSRAEIRRKFDEIVDFAEVEKFLDTPVKRYSSGMYVRLAFAVAAHLEPEILIVDEVLAVGDAEFQKKCLGKIKNVSEQDGRTVLFVSHNMGAISQLCTRAMVLQGGRMIYSGDTTSAVAAYLQGNTEFGEGGRVEREDDPSKVGQIMSITIRDSAGRATDWFSADETLQIDIHLRMRQKVQGLYCWIDLTRQADGVMVWMNDSFDASPNPLHDLPPGDHLVRLRIPARTLGQGGYVLNAVFTGPQGGATPVDELTNVCPLTIEDLKTQRGNQRPGYLSTLADWSVQPFTAV
jgi:lipopolysaccharide transport system ATP-binding protein